jgi:hypothetical protein
MAIVQRRRPAPTDEQKAKAAERRDRFRALAKQIADMSAEQRAEIVARAAAVVTCEGRPLSPVNTCSLMMQRSTVSVVGGFWQWKRAGRRVKKGEAGLSIWIPTMKGGSTQDPQPPTIDAETQAGEGEKRASRRFVVGTVFDITQTEEEPGHLAAREGAKAEGAELVEA